ncbi:sensor histidine kinase [Jatrophihabitans endophyticus]|uniref:sensor histidine kinase n=1 Tax=Jatrophihabitans endophyticus TaxID=1206085 RepID=UPI0019E6CE40|nr:histidine kinase [Jatrophihabitans endophyticus]MBE7189481.1 hypothetical protein [Jatrophihabitans endophyticus]
MTRSDGAVAVAVQRERQRIGDELHDGVQHRIVAALLCVRMLERELDRDDDRWRRLLAGAGEGLAASLAELRSVLVDARPPVDLATEVQALAANCPVPVQVDTSALPPVSARAARTVLRVTAEALTNTLKHADAAGAEVRLDADESSVRVRVRDDGRGDVSRSWTQPRLPGALSRVVAESGGTLRVTSGTRGTVVTARIPRGLP